MNPSEERLYRWLSEATEAAPVAADDDLLGDPGMMRCLDALTGQKPATLTDIEECYHDVEPPDDVEEREFSEAEETAYRQLSEMTDVPTRPTEARTVDVERRVIVPRSLIETINRSYAEIARAGFLTPRDFEERVFHWLSEGVQ